MQEPTYLCGRCSTRSTGVLVPEDEREQHEAWHAVMTTPEWPESLPQDACTALEELVHDQASELASNVVNNGSDAMRDYLLSNDWTLPEIAERIGLTPNTPTTEGNGTA